MAKLIAVSVNPDKIIQGIKGIRAVSGLGLKEAKHVADDLRSGQQQNVVLRTGERRELEASIAILAEHYVDARIEADVEVDAALLAARLAVVAIYRSSDPVDAMARLRSFAKVGAGDAFYAAIEIIDGALITPWY